MNSGTSTKQTGFQPGHFFLLMSMIGATVVVMTAKDTHPVALLLLSAAVISAGFVGLTMSRAVGAFFLPPSAPEPLPSLERDALLREKQLVLRSIKELEFDKAMGKISDADFASISAGLRARALVLMKDLDRPEAKAHHAPPPAPVAPAGAGTRATHACAECGTANDPDARFCKSCGMRMAQ